METTIHRRMKMREEFFEQIKAEIESWYKSQADQTDGYEYERSFSEMMQKLGWKILQGSVGELPKSRNGKKRSIPPLGG